jgi:hypothetical protein
MKTMTLMELYHTPVIDRNEHWHHQVECLISEVLGLEAVLDNSRRWQWLEGELDKREGGCVEVTVVNPCDCNGHFYDCCCEVEVFSADELTNFADSRR